MKTLCKQMLKKRIFLGHYQEKRYVAKLKTYKDLVVLNSSEKAFREDVVIVEREIDRNLNKDGRDMWMGFTRPDVVGAPAGYCIWTKLDESESTVPFGQYWFQVKAVRFKGDVIEIQLSILRPAEIDDSSTFTEFITSDFPNVEWGKLFISWKDSMNQGTYRFLQEQVTAKNMLAIGKFIALVIVLLATGLVHSVKYLGEFTLKFMHELSKLIRAMTPLLTVMLNMLSKIVGGFYILIAMMWRDTVGGGGPPPNFDHRPAAIQGPRSRSQPYGARTASGY